MEVTSITFSLNVFMPSGRALYTTIHPRSGFVIERLNERALRRKHARGVTNRSPIPKNNRRRSLRGSDLPEFERKKGRNIEGQKSSIVTNQNRRTARALVAMARTNYVVGFDREEPQIRRPLTRRPFTFFDNRQILDPKALTDKTELRTDQRNLSRRFFHSAPPTSQSLVQCFLTFEPLRISNVYFSRSRQLGARLPELDSLGQISRLDLDRKIPRVSQQSSRCSWVGLLGGKPFLPGQDERSIVGNGHRVRRRIGITRFLGLGPSSYVMPRPSPPSFDPTSFSHSFFSTYFS